MFTGKRRVACCIIERSATVVVSGGLRLARSEDSSTCSAVCVTSVLLYLFLNSQGI